jgi:hypothetical protein
MFRPVRRHQPITCNVRHKRKYKHVLFLSDNSYTTANHSVNMLIGLCYKKSTDDFQPEVLTVRYNSLCMILPDEKIDLMRSISFS